jgi:hypothetical protein
MQFSLAALAPELLRSLTHQAQVDRRTLVRHISQPPAHPHPAGERVRRVLRETGLDHLIVGAEKGR